MICGIVNQLGGDISRRPTVCLSIVPPRFGGNLSWVRTPVAQTCLHIDTKGPWHKNSCVRKQLPSIFVFVSVKIHYMEAERRCDECALLFQCPNTCVCMHIGGLHWRLGFRVAILVNSALLAVQRVTRVSSFRAEKRMLYDGKQRKSSLYDHKHT